VAFTRTQATAFLQERYGHVAADANLRPEDNALGWKPVIDHALRLVGTAASSVTSGVEVSDDDLDAFIPALQVAALWHFLGIYALRVNVAGGMPQQSAQEGRIFDNLQALYAMAAADLAAQGITPPDPYGVITQGRILLDVLEPDASGVG
jgi:hypothetical protein